MSRPLQLEALASLLRFDKVQITRAICFWSATEGLDQGVFDALSGGCVNDLEFAEPADADQLIDELVVERDVGRRHMANVVANFYDSDWRSDHTGDGVYPADHLWWATSGFLDLDNALKAAGR